MGKLPASDDGGAHAQCHGCGREDAACPGKPAGQVACEIGVFLGRELVGPEVLSACIGHGGCQFGKADAHTDGDQTDEDDSVDQKGGTAGIDAGDHGQGDSKP